MSCITVVVSVTVVVVVASKVLVAVIVLNSVNSFVSVVWTVVRGVMVRLLLMIGVMVVVLRAVCVTVTEVVVGVCRQEHANSMSDDGRERTLEKILAGPVGAACLLRLVTATVVLTVSVSVLSCNVSIRYACEYRSVSLHCDCVCDCDLSWDGKSRGCGGLDCFCNGLERYSHIHDHRGCWSECRNDIRDSSVDQTSRCDQRIGGRAVGFGRPISH